MIAELRPAAGTGVIWPCGPECRHGRPLTGKYGDWLWCDHPVVGGSIVHARHECAYYDPTPKPPPTPPDGFR